MLVAIWVLITVILSFSGHLGVDHSPVLQRELLVVEVSHPAGTLGSSCGSTSLLSDIVSVFMDGRELLS